MDSYQPTKMISKSIQNAVKKIREIWLYTLLFLVSAYIFRNRGLVGILCSKLLKTVLMVAVSMLSHAEFGRSDHREFALQFIAFLNIHIQHGKSTNLNRYFSFNSDLKIVRMKASKLRNKGDPYLSRFPNLMLCRNFLQSLFEIQGTALNLNDYRNTKVIKVIRGNE